MRITEEQEQLKRQRVLEAIAATGGNAKRAARLLEVPHRTFMYWAEDPEIRSALARARAARPEKSLEELLLTLPPGAELSLVCKPHGVWCCRINGKEHHELSPHRAIAAAMKSLRS